MLGWNPKDAEAARQVRERMAELDRVVSLMLVRDDFAKAALPLLVGGARTPATIARTAYEIADAMLAERTKTK